MYGRRKMTAHLRRQDHQVAACTVNRLMGDEGLSGVVRGRKHRTTIPGGKDSRRAPDLLDRDFTATAPNRKWSPTSPTAERGRGSSTWPS
jgi:transposase InsO family protein